MPGIVGMPDLIERYFSSDIWLKIFIVSVVYLFFRIKAAHKRALFAVVIAFFLIVNAFVIKQLSELGENSTFYRNLWSIPTMTIIGIAIIDIVRIIPKWYLKITLIIAFVIGLWFVNQNEYIRCRDQYYSSDAKMVSEDVINLANTLDKLRKEDGKKILFVVCPVGYERSYGNMATELKLYGGFLQLSDSSILNNSDHNGEEELTRENPDVSYIMSTCCAKGMDYVIVVRNKNAEEAFKKNGDEPIVRTDGFLLYRCQGYPGYRVDLYKDDKIAWIQYYDGVKNQVTANRGYSLVKYSYNNGQVVSEEYCDSEGRKIITPLGYTSYKREYNDSNQLLGETYYGISDEKLGRVSEIDKNEIDVLFHYIHCTKGVTIEDDKYKLSTSVLDNSFNLVHFQLFDAKTDAYLTDFGRGVAEGIVTGQYINEYPEGLYRLIIKGNTNLSDEYISCFVYLWKGTVLNYSYSIDEMDQQYIELSNLSVQIVEEE